MARSPGLGCPANARTSAFASSTAADVSVRQIGRTGAEAVVVGALEP